MLLRLAVSSLSCLMVFACNFTIAAKQPQQIPDSVKSSFATGWNSGDRVSNQKQSVSQEVMAKGKTDNYIALVTTQRRNALNNPIYELQLHANGELLRTYDTVSGRTHTQNRNRHRAGTEAPLPDGEYRVAIAPIRGTIPEAGDLFLPIQPSFQTGRSALGIHYDPSFEKDNGEDGTSGCIGLTSRNDLSQVLQYVRTYRPKYLQVKIQ